jgi:hypothetical protein
MEASQHSLLAACFTLHSINVTLAIVPQRGAGLWILQGVAATTDKIMKQLTKVKFPGIGAESERTTINIASNMATANSPSWPLPHLVLMRENAFF